MKYYRIPLRHMSTRRLLKSKTALGAPVGSLIMLVATVILCTTVLMYAVNVTNSQVQKEKLFIASSHVWYYNSSISVAAIAVCDTGSTDSVFSKIEIKGLQIQWNGTANYVVYTKINGTLPGDLPAITEFNRNGNTTAEIGQQTFNLQGATEGLSVQSGYTLVFYIIIPAHVLIYDLSTPIRMAITTTQSVYFTETMVQSA